jgi:DnaJ-class molecular chaperone
LSFLVSCIKRQTCWFSNHGGDHSSHSQYPKIKHGKTPFDILGVPKNSTYDFVKRRFIELAMNTHPDIISSSSPNDNNDNDVDAEKKRDATDEFIRLRQAFEAIREDLDEDNNIASWSDDNFKAWFFEETGHHDIMFKMDLTTRKEVIDIANNQSQGGLDKGGMWEMARNMAEQEKNLKKQKNNHHHSKKSIGLEESAGPSQGSNTTRRRRRKK